jgi:phi13 family phage major tail protein
MTAPIASALIGLEQLHYAILTDGSTPTYTAPVLIAPVITAKITPKVNTDTLYADNTGVEIATTLGQIDIELDTSDVPLAVQAAILGHALDTTKGVLSCTAQDKAPYVAIGFKALKANGNHRYVWLLKGMFEELSEEYATKEDKAKFSTPKLKGTFLPRQDGKWKYTADEDAGYTGGDSGWFTAVYTPATT